MDTEILKATVVDIVSENSAILPGTDIVERTQVLKVKLKDGGIITVNNSRAEVSLGKKVYLEKTGRGAIYDYNVAAVSKIPTLGVLLALFILITILVGKKQGVRGLVSLLITVFVIFGFLIPKLLVSSSPFILILGTTLFLTALSALVTHGRNRVTYAAISGMMITLVVSSLIGILASVSAGLTGLTDESSVYFMVSQNGSVNMQALFLGAVLIGLLGVLYDAAISQAVYVAETIKNSPLLSKKELLSSAMRFGREHIGALVDTLAIVSIGAALVDTLLIVKHASGPIGMILSNESVASHILQILVGSIGVIMAVPITTWIAVKILHGKNLDNLNNSHSHNH